MRTSSQEGFYRSSLFSGGALPVLAILLMSLNNEFPWRLGVLGHLLAGASLGFLGGALEVRVIWGRSATAWKRAGAIGAASFAGLVILGTLVAQRLAGPGELFSWLAGWGMVRWIVVRRAIGPFVPPPEPR